MVYKSRYGGRKEFRGLLTDKWTVLSLVSVFILTSTVVCCIWKLAPASLVLEGP